MARKSHDQHVQHSSNGRIQVADIQAVALLLACLCFEVSIIKTLKDDAKYLMKPGVCRLWEPTIPFLCVCLTEWQA